MRNQEKWIPYRELSGPSELWGVIVDGTQVAIIKPSTRLDASDCGLICATHNAAILKGEKSIWCESIVNRKGEPIIQITMGQETVQLDVRRAREHSYFLHETIEAAMSDAVLVRFIRDVVYSGESQEKVDHAVGNLLSMFRELRDHFMGKNPIETESETAS